MVRLMVPFSIMMQFRKYSVHVIYSNSGICSEFLSLCAFSLCDNENLLCGVLGYYRSNANRAMMIKTLRENSIMIVIKLRMAAE